MKKALIIFAVILALSILSSVCFACAGAAKLVTDAVESGRFEDAYYEWREKCDDSKCEDDIDNSHEKEDNTTDETQTTEASSVVIPTQNADALSL